MDHRRFYPAKGSPGAPPSPAQPHFWVLGTGKADPVLAGPPTGLKVRLSAA